MMYSQVSQSVALPPPLPVLIEPARSRLSAARTAAQTAERRLRAARREMLCRRLRTFSRRAGFEGWMIALIAGTLAAVIFATFSMSAGAGAGFILLTILVGYGAVGGAAACFFSGTDGEELRLKSAIDRYALASSDVMLARREEQDASRECLVIQERLNSIEYRRQQEMQRLLEMDAGRLYPEEFERYVCDVFKYLGYVTQHIGRTNDQGVDVIAIHGEQKLAIQVKHYTDSVGNKAVQEVYAGMAHYRCHRCIVVTSSQFTASAQALAQSTGCMLIGREQLGAIIRGQMRI